MEKNLYEQLLCKAVSIETGKTVIGFYYEHPIKHCVGPVPDPLCFLMVRDERSVPDWGFPYPVISVAVKPDSVRMSTGFRAEGGQLLFEEDVVRTPDGKLTGIVKLKSSTDGSRKMVIQWYDGEGVAVPEEKAPAYRDVPGCRFKYQR